MQNTILCTMQTWSVILNKAHRSTNTLCDLALLIISHADVAGQYHSSLPVKKNALCLVPGCYSPWKLQPSTSKQLYRPSTKPQTDLPRNSTVVSAFVRSELILCTKYNMQVNRLRHKSMLTHHHTRQLQQEHVEQECWPYQQQPA